MSDPVPRFRAWFDEARAAGLPMPEAMVLATATPEGRPSARWVLLKGVDERGGFLFYTNLESRKADELARNPRAALACFWESLRRQIRIEGTVEPVAAPEADAYWRSRHRGSQLSAFASPQSRRVSDRATMERARADVARRFEGRGIPRPAHWGGYRLEPVAIEFWEGRDDRFHDRVLHERDEAGRWHASRLWP